MFSSSFEYIHAGLDYKDFILRALRFLAEVKEMFIKQKRNANRVFWTVFSVALNIRLAWVSRESADTEDEIVIIQFKFTI